MRRNLIAGSPPTLDDAQVAPLVCIRDYICDAARLAVHIFVIELTDAFEDRRISASASQHELQLID